ncbi:solute carrier family 2, facilitated glucose transporter member 7-like [Rhineura floridana]|uniref:solute carrier family 2, facilitated glucose transporter member 7-like n=1 Tax=Rhineura floridana TaxID=261503 RepID=UPI002AC7EF99|nr:solute carrier family 2, facilitated glucose transporter member 7-like [Rhineura floridana]
MDNEEEEVVPNAAIKQGKLSKTLIWVSIATCLLSMQYGYNLWIAYSPVVLLQDYYNITSFEEMENPGSQMFLLATTLALFPLGGVFGSLAVGYLVYMFGRKGTLAIANILSIISAILMGCTNEISAFEYTMFVRLYTGICTGIISSVVPMYLGEISPGSLRGGMIMMPHLFLTIGVMFAQILALHEIFGTPEGWPILMSLSGVMPLCQVLLLPFFPQSPRYLFIQKKDEEKARQALKKLRGQNDVEAEMEELRLEDLAEKAEKNMNPLKLLSTPSLRWQTITIIVLMCGQQLAGTNVAYYYTERIYMSTEMEINHVRYMSIGSSAILIFSTTLGMYLVDTLGRRILLLIGFGICSTMCVLLTITLEMQDKVPKMSYLSTFFIILYLFGHCLGPGPAPPIFEVELFFQTSRGSAFVVAGFLQWFINFITGVSFLHIETRIGSFSFLLFFPVCVAYFYYTFKMIPETKNRTFLEIRRIMAIRAASRISVKGQMGK